MKQYKFRIIVLLISLSIFQISCKKDWLNAKADKNQAVASTLKDFQALLDYAHDFMNYFEPGIQEVASDGHYIPEAAWQGAANQDMNAYTWSHNHLYTFVDDWKATYSKIFTCNLILEGLEKMQPDNSTDQQIRDNIKGQALFHRAYIFFDVAQVFAPPYDSSSAAADLSIPLRLSSDITLPSVRSTVEQTYSRILNDLKETVNLLPIKALYLTRPSQPAVYASLARAYLSMRNYDSASVYADKCLQLYNSLLDYNTVDSTAGSIGVLNKEVLFHMLFETNYSGFISYNCLIDSSLFSLYAANDLRRSLFFLINSDSTISFQGNYNNTPDLFCGLATDEVYLIRAECFARKGNAIAAMNDLNTLLQNRWRTGTFVPFTASNADDALMQILTERRKELVLRGIRWQDLRRLNKEDRFKITITRTIAGNTYSIEPNSYKYTFPIPDDVIQLSGMKQNPGW